MNNRLKIATTPPKCLLQDLDFWLSDWSFLLRVFISLLFVVVVFAATYPQSGRTLDTQVAWMSNLFHVLTIWGAIAVIKIIAKIKVEHAIADYVDDKASNELRKIKNGERDRIILDRVESEILPNNEDEELGIMRIFKQILKEAKDRGFDSSTNLMESYREECIGDIFKLQSVQKIALQLGILGTFIGLIMALDKISLASAGQIIEQLSAALKISFGTSIAGLEVSIILWLFILLVRRKQEAYFKSMENATVTMVSLARNAINNDEFITEISQIKRYMEDLGNRIHDQSLKIQAQTTQLQTGMEKLANARTHFDEFLREITQAQIGFVDEIKTVYNIFSPTQISIELKSKLSTAVDSISDTFKTNLGEASGKLVELNSSLFHLSETLKGIEKQVQQQNMQIEAKDAKIHDAKTEFYNSVQQVNQVQLMFVSELRKNLDESNITKLNRELEIFNQTVQKMNRSHLAKKIHYFLQGVIPRLLGREAKIQVTPGLKENKTKN
jgi:biopolymer transport protein ExbB/TolQ